MVNPAIVVFVYAFVAFFAKGGSALGEEFAQLVGDCEQVNASVVGVGVVWFRHGLFGVVCTG